MKLGSFLKSHGSSINKGLREGGAGNPGTGAGKARREELQVQTDALVGFCKGISKANHIASKLESGIVWVNCWLVRDLRTPFGGMKNSGVGREGGWEALRFFTEAKNVCIQY